MNRGGDRGRGRGGNSDRGGGRGGGGYDRGRGGRGGGGHDRGGGGRGGGRGRGGGGYDRGGGERGGGGFGGGRGGPPGGGRGGGPSGPIIFGTATNADPKVKQEGDVLVAKLKKLKLSDDGLTPTIRPGYGTKGTEITLRANHFPLTVPKGPFYEYKIYYAPAVSIKRMRKQLLETLEAMDEYKPYKDKVAHDWSEKLIAASRLYEGGNALDFNVEDPEGNPNRPPKIYKISIQLVKEIPMDQLNRYLDGSDRSVEVLPLISALNIINAKWATERGVKVGRDRYFFKAGQSFGLGAGLEAWKGFYSSVRPTVNSLMVNVNVCYTAFYKEGRLVDAIDAFERESYGARANKFVENIRISPTHLSYRPKKTVRKLLDRTVTQVTFDCPEYGGKISIAEYFKKKYKINLPANGRVIDVGSKDKPTYLPVDVCIILPNQPFRGKLSDNHTAAMIKYACNKPADNARSIVNEGLAALGFIRPGAPTLANFGLSVSAEMAVVPARVLPPPGIAYSGNQPTRPANASWNLRNVRFFKGAQLSNWGIFAIITPKKEFTGPTDPALKTIVDTLKAGCTASGLAVGSAPPLVHGTQLNLQTQSPAQIHTALENAIKHMVSKGVTYIIIILPDTNKRTYAAIRKICDVQVGVHATCAVNAKIRNERGQLQYMANLALKINPKLGGINHTLDQASSQWLKREVTMLVGMDVTHPGPGSTKGTPSIAGVVASYDTEHTLYPASLRPQTSKQEMIEDLADMMKERLLQFQSARKALPKRIVVFRDGVSEGQFVTVLQEECPKFQDAFKRFNVGGKPYRPKLTIIICGKRHHTRFYPTKSDDGDERLGNPKPGTVVDRGITAIYEFDFFLQAHSGLQGQTRPTHYTVIYDENNFDADAAQSLINYSSYIYARATKAVSLVPPAYYADLVCERGRQYLYDYLVADASSSVHGGSGPAAEQTVYDNAKKAWGNGVHQKIAGSMFYL